ncbi:DUF397 domain-containing protein [Nocardia miyunensis]|uniref:DUF397 domain-containing protein n=1 Tax=Nocardia miyunensis TaxID=282684 RepID=UPI00083012EA|nr:DUF397 domain-containing protein [Nocardia miyunensis]
MSTTNTLASTSEHWFKSSRSNGNQSCVEVCFDDGAVLIRDSKYTGPAVDQPIIPVSIEDWPAILELALNRCSGAVRDTLTIAVDLEGGAVVRNEQGVDLSFTADEWDAFAKGVAEGQFDLR